MSRRRAAIDFVRARAFAPAAGFVRGAAHRRSAAAERARATRRPAGGALAPCTRVAPCSHGAGSPGPCLRLVAAIAAGLLVATAAPARAGTAGTQSPFAAGLGARASAMGRTGISDARTPSAIRFNPALVARLRRPVLEAYRTTFFGEASYHALAVTYPTESAGAYGLTIQRIGVPGIDARDARNAPLGRIDDARTRVSMAWGVAPLPGVALGAALVVDNHRIGAWSGTGVGVDLGLQVRRRLAPGSVFRTLRGALVLANAVEPSVRLDRESVPDPSRLSVGGSLESAWGAWRFVTALEFVRPRWDAASVRLGQEVTWEDRFAARLGVDGNTPTLGLGAAWRGVTLDYAWREEDLGVNHRVSLSIPLGPGIDQRIAERRRRQDAALRRRLAERLDALERRQHERLHAVADSLFAAGDYEAAASAYATALMWDPEDEPVRDALSRARYLAEIARGDSLAARGDWSAAFYRYRAAQRRRPGDGAAERRIAECRRRLDAQAGRERTIDAMIRAAIDLYASGRFLEARSAFDDVLAIDPDNAVARDYAAKAHARVEAAVQRAVLDARAAAERGRFDDALDALTAARAAWGDDPRLVDATRRIGEQRRAARARAHADRAERSTPPEREENARAPEGAAGAAPPSPTTTAPSSGSTGRTRPAAAPRDTRALDARFERGVRALEAGRFDEAARELAAVWSVAPAYRGVTEPLVRAWLLAGMRAYAGGDYAAAIRSWEKVLSVSPDNAKARRYLRRAREEAGRLTGVTP